MSMTSPKKFYHIIIIMYMWSCEQSFFNSSISMREVIITSILKRFDQKIQFFEEWSWFKYNNLGLTLGMALKFQASVKKGLKKSESFGANFHVCKSYRGRTGWMGLGISYAKK